MNYITLYIISFIFLSAIAKNDIAVDGIIKDKKRYSIRTITLSLLSFFSF
ncbi:hypothetical protein [uncultured Brachyspira sp.]|nr:hypothetical protein [uncultured Brachyspira sp.]